MGDKKQTYSLVLTRAFIKDFRKLSRQDQSRVNRALDDIQAAPYEGHKLTGTTVGRYRWRVGDLRIRYDIEEQVIYILRVLKREDVYRKF